MGDRLRCIVPYNSLERIFSTYTAGDYGRVKMGDDGACTIVGIGSVCLTTSTGCRLTVRDVRHVPDVRLNLISTGRLDNEATVVVFKMECGSSARAAS